jgi:sialate O-acetylesterase
LACGFLLAFHSVPATRAEVRLPNVLGHHMVLQRGADVPIWGKASPGENISVRGDWQKHSVTTRAAADGSWKVKIKTPAGGGSHTITIKGENEIVLHDVLIGEVWVCSGQSNMEMPVGNFGPGYDGVNNWQEELKHADLPNIRLFTVPNRHSITPQVDCEGKWIVCNAETAKAFSAAGFFFGRELHQTLNVPVGLISADYGGTVAEAWTSEGTIKTFPELTNQLAAVAGERDHADENAKARIAAWSNWVPRIESADGGSSLTTQDVDDSSWAVAPQLGQWSGDLARFDGYVWYRKSIQLSPEALNQAFVLDLGPIDDMDFTYVNGTKVGQTIGENTWSTPRSYDLPKEVLKPGTNFIAVRVLDTGGSGGITGPARLRSVDGREIISLDSEWRFKPGTPLSQLPALDLTETVTPNTATVLFNGMIAPIIPFGIRGVIWYQGESNIGRDAQYRRLFPAMIADWRKHWDEGDFPFYFTQIAPFRYPNPGMAAALRDAQRLSLATPNTGMAITMDSDSNNLHPHTKQAVGHRLALWALAKTYGKKSLVYSGPLYRKMKIEGDAVRLYFDHTGSGLTSNEKPLAHFEIAGADKQFVPAQARIDGETIVVWSDAISKPTAVRYAWGDANESSFGNREALPAASFRTDAAVR